jgi:YpzI-like protein
MYESTFQRKNKDRRCIQVGKDRQEKKLKQSKRVESDRDQGLHYNGATSLEGPEKAKR